MSDAFQPIEINVGQIPFGRFKTLCDGQNQFHNFYAVLKCRSTDIETLNFSKVSTVGRQTATREPGKSESSLSYSWND